MNATCESIAMATATPPRAGLRLTAETSFIILLQHLPHGRLLLKPGTGTGSDVHYFLELGVLKAKVVALLLQGFVLRLQLPHLRPDALTSLQCLLLAADVAEKLPHRLLQTILTRTST
jgi:hypothetical protein